jgi:hypothetical protein
VGSGCSGYRQPSWFAALLLCGTVLAAPATAIDRLVDVRRSTVTIHVFLESPNGPLADQHIIRAPLSEGTFDETIPHFQIVIDGTRLRVLDAARPAAERRQVQSRMLGPDVLDIDRFRWISFHSVTIEQRGTDRWLVHGELGLRGTVRPLAMTVARTKGRYQGSATVKQSDFGIMPVSAGVIQVKDDVQVDFDIAVTNRPA